MIFNSELHVGWNGDIESEVMEFVARTLRKRRDRLTVDTTLLGDLGVDGDDADEFFAAFAEKFHVNLSALNLSKHFGAEGFSPCQIPLFVFRLFAELVSPLISMKTSEERASLVPITISDLVAAARAGQWCGGDKE